MLRLCLLFAALLGALSLATPALALKIDSDAARPWRLLLSGPIVAGDAERFLRTLFEPLVDKPLLLSEIVLDSPGGNFAEALRLAALVKGLHLDSRVRGGGFCSSACFFVFLAGDRRLAREQVAGEQRPGRIGLHRPYLTRLALNNVDAASATQRQQEEMLKVSDYLRRENVPLRLIDEMMSHPSNDIYWLSDEDLWQLGEFNPGLEEFLIARCRYDKRYTSAAQEQLTASLDPDNRAKATARLDTLLTCIASARSHFDAQREAFLARLKGGWRPWLPAPK